MSRLIEFVVDAKSGSTILVETDDVVPAQGQARVSIGGVIAEKATEAFDATIAGIKPIAAAVLRGLADAVPDSAEIEVEFGVKVTGSAGVILASGSGEGNCKVTIRLGRKA